MNANTNTHTYSNTST